TIARNSPSPTPAASQIRCSPSTLYIASRTRGATVPDGRRGRKGLDCRIANQRRDRRLPSALADGVHRCDGGLPPRHHLPVQCPSSSRLFPCAASPCAIAL